MSNQQQVRITLIIIAIFGPILESAAVALHDFQEATICHSYASCHHRHVYGSRPSDWSRCLKQEPLISLTLRSSRTPPALPFALSQHLAITAPFIVSVQAWPLSFFR